MDTNFFFSDFSFVYHLWLSFVYQTLALRPCGVHGCLFAWFTTNLVRRGGCLYCVTAKFQWTDSSYTISNAMLPPLYFIYHSGIRSGHIKSYSPVYMWQPHFTWSIIDCGSGNIFMVLIFARGQIHKFKNLAKIRI